MSNAIKVINTPMQDVFLDALFEPSVNGDIRTAMRRAGYSDSTQIKSVVEPLKEQIVERAQLALAMHAGKAVAGIVGAIDNPNKLGTKNILKASTEILDRIGVIKKEQDTVKIPRGAIFFLPKKKNEILEGEYTIIDQDEIE